MQNRFSMAFVVALVLILALSATALAQGPKNGNPGQNGTGLCDNYVDADGDGVCDHAPQDGTGEQQGPNSSVGAGGAPHGAQDGSCDNYVDADGDDVNDSAPRDGTGNQHGRR